ncbi:MAG: cobaltochelatase subunit CobN, partial [Planctomycetales bacterium]|nr:cobaltochelatase subunit CobN [Planctomycetales bacterium]
MDVAPKRMAHIGGTLVALVVTVTTAISGQDARDRDAEVLPRKQSANVCRVAFVGLHGGMFDVIRRFAGEAGVEVDYIRDEQILEGAVPSVPYAAVFVQHVRDDHRDQYRDFVTTVTRQNANVRIYSFSGMLERLLPDLAQAGRIEHDDKLSSYYGNSPENLRRLLLYIRAVLLGGDGPVLPPETDLPARGLYHPDHALPFDTVAAFLSWAGTRPQAQQIDLDVRVAIAVHATHAMFQQPQVVMALIREFEERGVLAVAVIDTGDESPGLLRTLNPKIVVHTCHSGDTLESRIELGVPHVHSLFFRQQSIDQWRVGSEGLAASEMAFQIVGQELLGGIEPQIGAGTTLGGGSSEAFSPIPERIAHLVDRAMAWVRLATLPREEKKVAIIYYDREMGKAELMRGSATGMFLNGPRSLVAVLKRMQQAGYLVEPVPQDEDELLASMMDHGRQIGVWAPGELERLVRSGQSVLIPLATYEHWFQQYVPEELRRQVIDKWGPPPGKFLVWHNAKGASFLVIPRIDLGNVVLLPQPLRGEAHDTTLVHDKLVPPPHNYLATYWWLQEEFRANTMIHFGTHGSEFMLPGRSTGLSDHDWPDIVLGRMPNINPWILNNLGESSPVRRRAYAVLIDHLTPPAVNAELSDELENLHNDIDHWVILEDGALKEKFRQSITEQVVRQHLDQDLQLPTLAGRQLEPTEIEQVLSYLHDIHNETTPISLHVFGQPPPENLLVPYVTTCLGKAFIRALGDAVDVPPGEAVTAGDREKYLRRIGEKIVDLVVRGGLSPTDALAASNEVNAQVAGIDALQRQLVTAQQLSEGLQQADQEMQGLLTALDGKFVEPGPGNSPDRNPGALPTGRNMYVMNPEEVPTRASWELGCQLIDQLLSQ